MKMDELKNKLEVEIKTYVDRFDKNLTDQMRADAWMLIANGVHALKEIEILQALREDKTDK